MSRARPTAPWQSTSAGGSGWRSRLVPILIVIGLLVLYIRALPIPAKPADAEGGDAG